MSSRPRPRHLPVGPRCSFPKELGHRPESRLGCRGRWSAHGQRCQQNPRILRSTLRFGEPARGAGLENRGRAPKAPNQGQPPPPSTSSPIPSSTSPAVSCQPGGIHHLPPLGHPLPTPSPPVRRDCVPRKARPLVVVVGTSPRSLGLVFFSRDSASSLVLFLPLPLPQIKETHPSPLSNPQCITAGHGCSASVSLEGQGSPRPLLRPGRGKEGRIGIGLPGRRRLQIRDDSV